MHDGLGLEIVIYSLREIWDHIPKINPHRTRGRITLPNLTLLQRFHHGLNLLACPDLMVSVQIEQLWLEDNCLCGMPRVLIHWPRPIVVRLQVQLII